MRSQLRATRGFALEDQAEFCAEGLVRLVVGFAAPGDESEAMAMVMMQMQQHHGHGAPAACADSKASLGGLGARRIREELTAWKPLPVVRPLRLEVHAARKNQSGSRYQQTKRWKVDESVKKIGHAGIEKFRSSFEDKESASGDGLVLRGDQAVGQVIAAQANFMRVFIERTGHEDQVEGSFYGPLNDPEDGDDEGRRSGENAPSTSSSAVNAWEVNCGAKAGTELLCVVRAVLKKIKRRVLVGDRVLVSGIDWVDRRGMVEDVLDRRSEIAEPPVANVEHMFVLFAFDRPKLEPIALSRFLIEAESTGIPFTLILNKADLVPQRVRYLFPESLTLVGQYKCCVTGLLFNLISKLPMLSTAVNFRNWIIFSF